MRRRAAGSAAPRVTRASGLRALAVRRVAGGGRRSEQDGVGTREGRVLWVFFRLGDERGLGRPGRVGSHYKWAAFVKWLASGVSKNWPNLHLTGSQFSFYFWGVNLHGPQNFCAPAIGPVRHRRRRRRRYDLRRHTRVEKRQQYTV
jgi:hypothetical protein